MKLKIGAVIWLFVAFYFLSQMNIGGEKAILIGWGYLIWTAPFSFIWWFYISPLMQDVLSDTDNLFFIGNIVVVFLSFLFWFVLIPKVHKFLVGRYGKKKI